MPIIRSAESPIFQPPGATITGLASPGRGSHQLSMWRVRLHPGTTPEHRLDKDEVFAILSGQATFTSNGVAHNVFAGDTVIVPAGSTLCFYVAAGHHLEAICAMNAGGRATMTHDSIPFLPPWTV